MRRAIFLLLLALPAYAGRPLDVQFIAQKPGYCGPAALAMLAGFYGQPVSQDDIASAIYLPAIHGTLTADLAGYAKHFNLWVRQYRSTPTDIRQKLSVGIPVIVLGKFGDRLHFFVVLGFDEFAGTVSVHTDQRAGLVMSQEQFWRVWDRADRWTLLVCPPSKAIWKLSADEHNDLGVFLEQTGDLPAAAGNYRRATELAPTNSYFQTNLGNALLKQKLFSEAVIAFRQAIQLEPDNADARNNLAWAYRETGANLDEAAELCRQAVKLQPGRRAYYLDTLGCVLLKQGKASEAVATFEQALAATTEREAMLRSVIQQHRAAVLGGSRSGAE
jgi:predicted double-glycine peptidase